MAATDGRRRGPRARTLLLVVVALALLWTARERVLVGLGEFLVVSDPPAAVDAILVLSGEPTERVWEAADLLREGRAPLLVLTTPLRPPAAAELAARGVVLEGEPEVARRIAAGLGVPPAAVLQVPDAVDSTEDEALAFRRFAAGRGWRAVAVVTSPYHTRRTRALFREVLGPAGIRVSVVPSRHGAFRAADWWRRRAGVRNLIVEYQKLLFYALPGHQR
jgi:uncharacterized SAM-binding protein YcdF (DUF218 family)